MEKRVSIVVASARGVAERWHRQYYDRRDSRWQSTVSGSGEITYDKLCALGQNPDVEEVAKIIGNKSWSHISCSGCGDYVTTAVVFKREFSESEVCLCAACIEEASRAFAHKDET